MSELENNLEYINNQYTETISNIKKLQKEKKKFKKKIQELEIKIKKKKEGNEYVFQTLLNNTQYKNNKWLFVILYYVKCRNETEYNEDYLPQPYFDASDVLKYSTKDLSEAIEKYLNLLDDIYSKLGLTGYCTPKIGNFENNGLLLYLDFGDVFTYQLELRCFKL